MTSKPTYANRPGIRGTARYFGYLRVQWRRCIFAYGLSVALIGLMLAAPWPLKILIDRVLSGTDLWPVHPFTRTWPQPDSETAVLLVALSILLIAALTAIVLSAEKVAHARIRERFAASLRGDLLNKIQQLNRPVRQQLRSGELTLRLTSDTQLASRLFCKTLPNTVRLMGTVAFTLGSLFWIDPGIGVAALTLSLMLAAAVLAYTPRLSRAARSKREAEGTLAALTQETVRGIEHVQTMGLQRQSQARFRATSHVSLTRGVEEVRVGAGVERTTQCLAGATLALVAALGGSLVLRGHMSLGMLTVCLAYITALLKPIEKINEIAMNWTRGMARVDRLERIFAADTGRYALPGATVKLDTIDSLQCRDVTFRYPGSDRAAIQHFQHTFVQGEATALSGPSGSGKSTLMRLILGQISPVSGAVTANGVDFRQLNPVELNRHFAVVSQDVHLFSGTVRELLCELAPNARNADVRAALERVAMWHTVSELPNGLETQVDETASQVSGGQRARLLLARALLSRRSVLMLDEPFANIDEQSKRIIVSRLRALKPDHIIIVTTHEPTLLQLADHILEPAHWSHSGSANKEEVRNA